MTTTTKHAAGAAAPYLAAVAEALVDVPEAERTELLDDLADHLAELEAEHGAGLAERLGAPSAYAAELVASAGLGPAGTDGGDRAGPGRASALLRRWSSDGWMGALGRFATEAAPGWWVVRAWLVCALVAFVGDGDELFPVPDVLGNPVLSALALAGAAVASVRVGRLGGGLDRLATVVGVVGLAVALTQGQPRTQYVYSGPAEMGGVLTGPDGRVIWNIWPYDGEGAPLTGVFLFDQDGVPIATGDACCVPPGHVPVPGLFPLPQSESAYDAATGTERQVTIPPPTVSIPRLPAAPSSTTVPTTEPATESTEPVAEGTEPADQGSGSSTTTAVGPGDGGAAP